MAKKHPKAPKTTRTARTVKTVDIKGAPVSKLSVAKLEGHQGYLRVFMGETVKQLSAVQLVDAVAEGLPAKAYLNIQKDTGLSKVEIAEILGVSPRYLQTKTGKDRLNTTASERLVKLVEIWNFGVDVFAGDEEDFKEWLDEPLAPLEGKTPLELMTNFIGMEQVKQLLGRIQYGVYS